MFTKWLTHYWKLVLYTKLSCDISSLHTKIFRERWNETSRARDFFGKWNVVKTSWWKFPHYKINGELLWWVCASRSKFLSLTVKSTPSTAMLPWVSSIPFKTVFEFILLEAVIWRPSVFLENLSDRSPTPYYPNCVQKTHLLTLLPFPVLEYLSFQLHSIQRPALRFRP